MKKSFTLIEILVVATIIVLLTSIAVVSYSVFLKQSHDTKRKTDLEQLRAALEMYRSNNDTYPTTSLTQLTTPTVYIESVPKDPKDPDYTYYYSGSISDYTLAAQLEGASSCSGIPANSCGTGNPCNYCVGPYGSSTVILTPTPTPTPVP